MSKQFFIDDVRMDTQTAFMANGNINIYPCSWERDKDVAREKTRMKGRMTTDEDGTSNFEPYNIGSQGARYKHLFATESAMGVVKKTRGEIIVQMRYPRRFPLGLIRQMFNEDTEDVAAFLKTRREETLWED